MSTQSPIDQQQSGGSQYGSGQSENGKSGGIMNLGFLKGLTEKKNTRVDGQPLKRRGPKPDSKPALTRRQELNRQAQRTHRERKELYIKALEQEVLRLKENFSQVTHDKDSLAEENRQLKQLLAQHGIPWTGSGGVDEFNRNGNAAAAYSSSGSLSGSYALGSAGFNSPTHGKLTYDESPSPVAPGNQSMALQQKQHGVDYDQAGIDFVLTYGNPNDPSRSYLSPPPQLERPCMDHMQFLVERSSEPEGEPCGHALMATCPPEPFPENNPTVPFGHGIGALPTGQKTWDISKGDLASLLDLSKRLNLDGEITPVMAFGMMLAHPRFSELTVPDFKKITEELAPKVRCYGFGAVLEEFEVRDAIESVFYTEPELGML